MTKLEQVARAIQDRLLERHVVMLDDQAIYAARAGVEALRAGWDGMFEAAMALPGSQEPYAPWSPPMPDEVWTATLDAILNEKSK